MAGYAWDAEKNRRNRQAHGIGFAAAERFEWGSAAVEIDDGESYGELREIATGFIGDVLHVLVFTRRGESIRIISLRKATRKERKKYGQEAR